jgi:hypothetical protein
VGLVGLQVRGCREPGQEVQGPVCAGEAAGTQEIRVQGGSESSQWV